MHTELRTIDGKKWHVSIPDSKEDYTVKLSQADYAHFDKLNDEIHLALKNDDMEKFHQITQEKADYMDSRPYIFHCGDKTYTWPDKP